MVDRTDSAERYDECWYFLKGIDAVVRRDTQKGDRAILRGTCKVPGSTPASGDLNLLR